MTEISNLLTEIEADLKTLHEAIQKNRRQDHTKYLNDALLTLKPDERPEPDPAAIAEKKAIEKEWSRIDGMISEIRGKIAKAEALIVARN